MSMSNDRRRPPPAGPVRNMRPRPQGGPARARNREQLAAQRKTVAEVRAYKRAVYQQERAIALERIGFVKQQVPDGSEPVLMVQAARHVIAGLVLKLTEAGITPALTQHEQKLAYAITRWLEANAGLLAMDRVDKKP